MGTATLGEHFGDSRATLDPGPVWTCWQDAGGVRIADTLPRADTVFRWLHLDLWDRRSLLWIERAAGLPPEVHALFTGLEAQPRAVAEQGFVGLVLPDFEREFDRNDTGRIGALHMALGPALALTGRHHPLHTPDIIRHRAAQADAIDAATALDLVLGAITATLGERTRSIATELLAIEDQLLAEDEAPDMRALVTMRRLSARLHRMAGSMRAMLLRLDADTQLPPVLRPAVARAAQQLHGLEVEIVATQGQLRLLREELDLQAAQRTNENVYLLSIITALLMPATLVTGFFGMNTGGMPLEHGIGGTLAAGVLAVGSPALTWLVLRKLGLVRH